MCPRTDATTRGRKVKYPATCAGRETFSYNTRDQPLLRVVYQMVIEVAGTQLRRPQLLWLCSTLYIAPDKLESVKPFYPIRSESLKTEYKPFLLSQYSDKCSR